MADTFTTNLNLTKPEVGASTDTWGTKINADLDALDAIFAVAGTAVNVKFASANFDDNAKAIFGTGDDLEIYHSGSHSIIKDGGTGNLLIQGDSVKIMNAAGDETFIDMPTDMHVALNYNNATKIQTSNTGATVTGTLVSDSLTVDTITLVVDASNNRVGIGTSSPTKSLHIYASADTAIRLQNSTTGTGTTDGFLLEQGGNDSLLVNYEAGNMRFFTSNTERMRIDSSGNVLIAGTSFSAIDGATQKGIALRAVAGRQINCLDSGANAFEFSTVGNGNAGEITCTGTSTNYSTSSDYRLKNVKGNVENALERTLKLNPVVFEWKADKRISEGFIAHEAQEIFADAVNGEKDGEKMQSMDYGRITPLLVKAIQEQQTQIDALQSEINTLKGE